MCWYNQIPSERKVAESDVKVVKFLAMDEDDNNVFYSPYNPFRYELGKVYTEEGFKEPEKAIGGWYNGLYVVNLGFHTYSLMNKFEVNNGLVKVLANDSIFLDSWYYLHDVTYIHDIEATYCVELPMFLCLCTIPKGAAYYINDNGECVSEKIRIDKVLDYLENLTDENEDEFTDTFKHYYDL